MPLADNSHNMIQNIQLHFLEKNSLNSAYNWAASVLLCAITNAGICSVLIIFANRECLPCSCCTPVKPGHATHFCTPAISDSIATG